MSEPNSLLARIGHIRTVWVILAAVLIWYFAC